jgi:hypothetical protein
VEWSWAKPIGIAMSLQSCWMPDSSTGCSRPCTLCRLANNSSSRALEVNTAVPLPAAVVRWWREEGGEAITFGSDAHDPALLASGLAEAAAMVEAYGFRPGRHPFDLWTRTR